MSCRVWPWRHALLRVSLSQSRKLQARTAEVREPLGPSVWLVTFHSSGKTAAIRADRKSTFLGFSLPSCILMRGFSCFVVAAAVVVWLRASYYLSIANQSFIEIYFHRKGNPPLFWIVLFVLVVPLQKSWRNNNNNNNNHTGVLCSWNCSQQQQVAKATRTTGLATICCCVRRQR